MENLVLTLDYELYGDGSGDVFRHVIEPTRELMRYFDDKGIKTTIFVEMVEFNRLDQEWHKGNQMGYDTNPFDAVAQQIQSIYRHGHDVQLHLHPQWVNAHYLNGKWLVDDDNWMLGNYDEVNGITLEQLILSNMQSLERIIRQVDPAYRCVALRAGGYNVQPSERLVRAMKSTGMKLDSSIVPMAVQQGKHAQFDFTRCSPAMDYWHVDTSLEVASCGDAQLVELPLASMPVRRIQKLFSRARLKSILNNSASATASFQDKANSTGDNSLIGKIRYLFETEYVTWDFCLMGRNMHRRFLRTLKNRKMAVLVGHPKGFTSLATIQSLLQVMPHDVEFITVSDFLAKNIDVSC